MRLVYRPNLHDASLSPIVACIMQPFLKTASAGQLRTNGRDTVPLRLAALTATLGLAAAAWVVAVRQMNGMDMGVATQLGFRIVGGSSSTPPASGWGASSAW